MRKRWRDLPRMTLVGPSGAPARRSAAARRRDESGGGVDAGLALERSLLHAQPAVPAGGGETIEDSRDGRDAGADRHRLELAEGCRVGDVHADDAVDHLVEHRQRIGGEGRGVAGVEVDPQPSRRRCRGRSRGRCPAASRNRCTPRRRAWRGSRTPAEPGCRAQPRPGARVLPTAQAMPSAAGVSGCAWPAVTRIKSAPSASARRTVSTARASSFAALGGVGVGEVGIGGHHGHAAAGVLDLPCAGAAPARGARAGRTGCSGRWHPGPARARCAPTRRPSCGHR